MCNSLTGVSGGSQRDINDAATAAYLKSNEAEEGRCGVCDIPRDRLPPACLPCELVSRDIKLQLRLPIWSITQQKKRCHIPLDIPQPGLSNWSGRPDGQAADPSFREVRHASDHKRSLFNGWTQKNRNGFQETKTSCSFGCAENDTEPKTNVGRKRKRAKTKTPKAKQDRNWQIVSFGAEKNQNEIRPVPKIFLCLRLLLFPSTCPCKAAIGSLSPSLSYTCPLSKPLESSSLDLFYHSSLSPSSFHIFYF